MQNFTYYTPTKIVFGKDSENQVGNLLKQAGAKKVLIHYGGQSAKKSGLLDTVCEQCNAENIPYILLGGVVPNPLLSMVHKGIEVCKAENIDFILAVGGGSVIDSAKAIALGSCVDFDVWDFFSNGAVPTNCLKLGSILTLAAAGSEMSPNTVITNEEGLIKRGYASDLCRCTFSILNPELTMSLPEWQTMSGVVDIIMHTLERYFHKDTSNTENTSMITDSIAEGLIKKTIENALILKDKAKDYNARAEIMWAGTLSHNSLTQCGFSQTDWATHQIEHELSGMFDVTHGAGLSAVWGSWARYVMDSDYERFAKLGKEVFNISETDSKQAAIKAIEAMERFFESIGMPTTISKLGLQLTNEQTEELAYKCTFKKTRTVGSFKVLDLKDIKEIYIKAL